MLHATGYAGAVGWGQQQVHMVGHEHPCMYGERMLVGTFTQPMGICFDVSFSCKADLPVVSPLNDVDGKPRGTIAISSWHERTRSDSSLQFLPARFNKPVAFAPIACQFLH